MIFLLILFLFDSSQIDGTERIFIFASPQIKSMLVPNLYVSMLRKIQIQQKSEVKVKVKILPNKQQHL